jgi:hypothetical protein
VENLYNKEENSEKRGRRRRKQGAKGGDKQRKGCAENRAQETQMGKEKRALCVGRNIKGVGDPGEQAG